MVDKKTLIDWLKKGNVAIVSADVEALPGLPGETVTIILTNSKPEIVLTGANRLREVEDDEATKRRKDEDAKKVQEGWEE